MFNVLVIDNDLSIYQFLKAKLIEHNISKPLFYFAKDFHEAKLIKDTEKIDLILVDIHLSGMNGIKIIEKTNQLLPGIPVIIFTDFNDEDLALECIKHGAQDYILKSSINIKSLIKSLKLSITRYQKMISSQTA